MGKNSSAKGGVAGVCHRHPRLTNAKVILLNQDEVNQIEGLIRGAQQQAAAAPAAEAPKLEKKAEKKN